jgi:hypothetical protein
MRTMRAEKSDSKKTMEEIPKENDRTNELGLLCSMGVLHISLTKERKEADQKEGTR